MSLGQAGTGKQFKETVDSRSYTDWNGELTSA